MKKVNILFLFSFLLPIFVFAQTSLNACATVKGIAKILCNIAFLLNSVIPILIALGVVYFIWGVVQYVIASSDDAKGKGKDKIIWGLVGLTVVVSVWGLVALIKSSLGIEKNESSVPIPCIPGPNFECKN